MDTVIVLDIAREAVITVLKIAAPIMLIALTVGLIVSLFQALTQIQEMTLAFVPKILVIFLSVLVFLPYMLATLTLMTEQLYSRIVTLS
ncbi:MAG: flagellar biosynthesis protein FliQ [Rhodospirillaceae bacterium]|nr:flagellar biosynthesis protein FliQ [Rhodospirillaceae bacterium]